MTRFDGFRGSGVDRFPSKELLDLVKGVRRPTQLLYCGKSQFLQLASEKRLHTTHKFATGQLTYIFPCGWACVRMWMW